jgi:hypothetical protein
VSRYASKRVERAVDIGRLGAVYVALRALSEMVGGSGPST